MNVLKFDYKKSLAWKAFVADKKIPSLDFLLDRMIILMVARDKGNTCVAEGAMEEIEGYKVLLDIWVAKNTYFVSPEKRKWQKKQLSLYISVINM